LLLRLLLQGLTAPKQGAPMGEIQMFRTSLIAFCLLVSGSALAQAPYTAAEMQALLAKGLLVNSSDLEGGKVFTGRVTLGPDGKLSGASRRPATRPLR
jgi:hypothetical protein